MMKVLSIGSDRNLFKQDSAVRTRVFQYAKSCEEYHVIVFSLKSLGLLKTKVGRNLWIYPTNSKNKMKYISDAVRLGKKIINDDNYIVTTQDPFESGLVGKRITDNKNVPLHVQIHTDFLSPHFKKQSFLNRIRIFLSHRILPKADCIRVVSKRIKNSLLDSRFKIQDSRITILPIFVDIKEIQGKSVKFDLHEKYPKFENIMLVTSRLESERNVALAIDALNEIVKEYPKTGLVIVGDGNKRKALELQAISYKLQANVIFEGWQNELVSYYKGADIFLNTSNYDGYGMSLMEAAAAGLPVVTTDVGLVGDILMKDSSALVCDVSDKRCLSEQILRILGDTNLKNSLISKASKAIIADRLSFEDYLKEHKLKCKKQTKNR